MSENASAKAYLHRCLSGRVPGGPLSASEGLVQDGRVTVELSITCWERTYREVLAPGFVSSIAKASDDPFSERTVVINNVTDRTDAIARAEALIDAGEISRYRLVDQELPRALAVTGLTQRRLGPVPHYTDHFLVAVTGAGAPYLCHWDSDCKLLSPKDWVTPSVAYLKQHRNILVAGPGWTDPDGMVRERAAIDGSFDLGFGFTDHVFLVERARLAAPVYSYVAPASWWYPTSHLAPIFEQRVDAYMRRKRLMRATFREAVYFHDEEMVVQSGGGWRRAKRKAHALARVGLERWWPGYNPVFVRFPVRDVEDRS